jgi:hypothetical protein
MSSTIACSTSLAGILRSLLQDECFDGPDKIRLGVAIRLPVSGMQLGQVGCQAPLPEGYSSPAKAGSAGATLT